MGVSFDYVGKVFNYLNKEEPFQIKTLYDSQYPEEIGNVVKFEDYEDFEFVFGIVTITKLNSRAARALYD